MTKETLNKALLMQAEIDKLQRFVRYCKNCWKILRIQRYKKVKFETAYGMLKDSISVSPELADRILDTIEEYIADKKKELESL